MISTLLKNIFISCQNSSFQLNVEGFTNLISPIFNLENKELELFSFIYCDRLYLIPNSISENSKIQYFTFENNCWTIEEIKLPCYLIKFSTLMKLTPNDYKLLGNYIFEKKSFSFELSLFFSKSKIQTSYSSKSQFYPSDVLLSINDKSQYITILKSKIKNPKKHLKYSFLFSDKTLNYENFDLNFNLLQTLQHKNRNEIYMNESTISSSKIPNLFQKLNPESLNEFESFNIEEDFKNKKYLSLLTSVQKSHGIRFDFTDNSFKRIDPIANLENITSPSVLTLQNGLVLFSGGMQKSSIASNINYLYKISSNLDKKFFRKVIKNDSTLPLLKISKNNLKSSESLKKATINEPVNDFNEISEFLLSSNTELVN